MAAAAVDALLRHVIDYAGTFPPARRSLHDASREYLDVRQGSHAWLLGAFVVAAADAGAIDASTMGDAPFSIVMPAASADAIDAMRRTAASLHVQALEFPPADGRTIRETAAAAPPETQLFFEVAVDHDMERRLDAIAAAGACGKLRTGGITAAAFPPDVAVHRFLAACAERQLRCKATAGLHHAIAGSYPMTYEPHSATTTMFGFLNICVAAVLIRLGAPADDVRAMLLESDDDAVAVEGNDMIWRGYRLTSDTVESTRQLLFLSFGSCSVREPIDDLTRLHLL